MNKRITSLLLAVVMICSMLATAVPVFAAPGDSGVSASVTEASPGDTFTVTLTVPGTEKQISDIGVKVHFDSTVFEVTEYTIPSIAGMAKMQSNVAEANSNAFFSATYDSDSSDADITFTGLQLTATFKVKEGAAAGTYAFELDSTCKVGSLTDMGLPDILVKYEDFTSKSVSVTVTVPHTHAYDQEVATAEHLKTPATCTSPDVYYKSCTCGENGTETFTSGSALGHDYTQKFEDAAHLKTAASKCTEHNIYWYDCSRCDSNAKNDPEAADKYFTSTTTGSHSFTEKIEDAAHYMAGTGTDCQSVKQYYYDCAYCDQIGTATWDSTTYGAHTEGTEWKFDENNHWHICTVEGCGVVIESSKEAHTPDHPGHATEEYAIKCTKCDYVIEAQLGHTHVFDKEVATDAYKASDATCTAKATYYKSCACGEKGTATFEYGELADHNWTPATCTAPKTCSVCQATEGDPLGHTEGTEWKSDKDNHWHTCTVAGCGVVIESSKAAHTPDREAATETDPIKCSVCDYIITPALGMQDYIVEMPVSIAVKLTGDKKPAKETFKFEIYDLGVEDAEFEILNDSVTAENIAFDENGVAFIEGIIKIKVTGEDQLCNLTEGFNVRMVKGSTKGWTYASEQWRIEPFFENDALDLKIAVKEIVDGEISEEYANGMSFSVSYEAVTEPETPKTGDSSMMVLWIALLFVSGVGVVGTTIYSRKKKYTVK